MIIAKKINLLYLFIFSIIISYAFIEGFRMPNLWSINYYLPNFFDGFYRRALPGTILSFFGDYRFNYYTIASIQFVILTSLLLWIYYLFQKNILIALIISLYLISPAGSYLFHEVGYIDQLLYLILFVAIAIFNKYKTFSIVLFSSSMLVHEMALFVTLPIYFTYLYIHLENFKKSILYILPSLLIFLIIYTFFQTVSPDTIQFFIEKISTSSNYKLRSDFYTIFTNTFNGERNNIYYSIGDVKQIFLLLPVISLSSLIIYKLDEKKKILPLLVFITGLTPLILGFYGWDISRWFFLSISSLTITFVVILLHYKTTFLEIASKQSVIVLYFIFYALLISNLYLGFFDGYKHRSINLNAIKEIKNEFSTIPIK